MLRGMASKKAGPGCLIPFGLLFVVVGCIPGGIALNDLRRAQASADWVETTAHIIDVDLQHGDDTDSVVCHYRYRAPDPQAAEAGTMRDYEGERVGVHGGSDNLGSWQRDTWRRLDRARQEEQRVPCWYDPADPASAVLNREVRWGLLGFMFVFPLVFGLAGGGLAWFGWHQVRRKRLPAPDPQVLSNQELIDAEPRRDWLIWIAALVWNAIAWGVAIGAALQQDLPWPAWLLIGLFPLIGLLLIFTALRATARSLRHGRPQLRRESGTWSTGNRVQAIVLTRTAPQPGDRIAARLLVMRRVTTEDSDGTSVSNRTEWEIDLAVAAQDGSREAGLWLHRVELPLPSDLPPAGEDLTWRLEWQLIRPGPDLTAAFVLPVVAGPPEAALTAAEVKLAADRSAPLAVLAKAGVRVSEERGDVVITLPAWRNPGLHLTGLITCAVLTAGAAALYQVMGWWIVLLAVPILLPSWRGAVRSALWRSSITLSAGRITVSAGWWRSERHDVKPADVTEVERKSNMSSGHVAWYNMWLKTADGLRIPIARGVPGPAAVRIAELIEAVRS